MKARIFLVLNYAIANTCLRQSPERLSGDAEKTGGGISRHFPVFTRLSTRLMEISPLPSVQASLDSIRSLSSLVASRCKGDRNSVTTKLISSGNFVLWTGVAKHFLRVHVPEGGYLSRGYTQAQVTVS